MNNIFKSAQYLSDYLQLFDITLTDEIKNYFKKVYILPNSCHINAAGYCDNSESPQNIKLNLHEVVNRFISKCCHQKIKNCMALGYGSKSLFSEIELKYFHDIECTYANGLHSYIYSKFWNQLNDLVSIDVMEHLFSCPILIPTENNYIKSKECCYIQICGIPIPSIIYQSVPNNNSFYSNVIPRYQILYKLQTKNKLNVYIKNIKKDISATLIESIFCANADDKAVIENLTIFQTLLISVISNYETISIDKIFNKLCPNTLLADDILDSTTSLISKSKRTRRGCRSGEKVKRRKLNHTHYPIDSFKSINTNNKLESIVDSTPVVKIGNMISNQLVENQITNCNIDNHGYQSQFLESTNNQSSKCSTYLGMNLSTRSRSSSINAFISSQTETQVDSDITLFNELDVSPEVFNTANCSSISNSNQSIVWSGLPNVAIDLKPVKDGTYHHLNRPIKTKLNYKKKVNNQSKILIHKFQQYIDKDQTNKSIISLATPADNVIQFIISIVVKCFSIANTWGSRYNYNKFCQSIEKYIILHKNESLTLGILANGYHINDIPWLTNISNDHNKRLYLANFINWIYNTFINSLLSYHFYITEGEGSGIELLHYRKDVWKLIVDFGNKQIEKSFVQVYSSNPYTHNNQGNDKSIPKISSWWNPIPLSSLGPKTNPYKDIELIDNNPIQVNASSSNVNDDIIKKPNENIKNNEESKLYYPTVRYLPKKKSIRAITNMKVKYKINNKLDYKSNDSSKLYNCLHILTHLYNLKPSLIGFGVFGFDDIYKHIKLFKHKSNNYYNSKMLNDNIYVDKENDSSLSQLSNTHSTVSDSELTDNKDNAKKIKERDPKYYIAVLDLEKCYDNVDSKQLYDIIDDIISNNMQSNSSTATNIKRNYTIHKYSISHYVDSLERVVTKYIRHVTNAENTITFPDIAEDLSKIYRKSIICDGVLYPRVNNDLTLTTLKQHLFEHIVHLPSLSNNKPNNNLYTQIKGIPQGSILSPILCNLYYGKAEAEIFGTNKQIETIGLKDKTLILRLMDDYIVISLDKSCVTNFLQRAYTCLKSYGSGINPMKTKVNYCVEVEFNGNRVKLPQVFSKSANTAIEMKWCGFTINSDTLEFKPDYCRLLERPLSTSFTMSTSQQGIALRKTMKSFIRMKCHALVLDNNLNSYDTVVKTIYRLFYLSALRTISYIKKMNNNYNIKLSNIKYICKCINYTISYGSKLIHTRTKYKTDKFLLLSKLNNKNAEKLSNFDQVVTINKSNDRNQYGECLVTIRKAQWLGYQAFYKVLRLKKSIYHKIIIIIDKRITSLSNMIGNDNILSDSTIITNCCEDIIDQVML